MDREQIIKDLLSSFDGEDSTRGGLKDTPKRVAKMYDEILIGYKGGVENLFKSVFDTDNDSMVVIKDIDYFSLCEHHLVPFFGKVHIGYIPNKKVLGLSKFARLVDIFSRRLQIQEQMTFQIAEALEKHLNPAGVIVVVEGQHLCMAMRGVQKINSVTTTSAVRGAFRDSDTVKQEFYQLLYK